eukprot:COSAG02_NODE_40592_length_403_cov_5.223684_1_plen_50_part_10
MLLVDLRYRRVAALQRRYRQHPDERSIVCIRRRPAARARARARDRAALAR